MKKFFKNLFRAAVGVVLPVAAPALAQSLSTIPGLGFFASRAGDIAAGAGLGALTAKATGGDWRTGALLGGGITAVGGPVRAPEFRQATLGELTGQLFGGSAQAGATPSTTTLKAGVSVPGAPAIAPTAVSPLVGYGGMGDVLDAAGTAAPTFGQQLGAAVRAIPGQIGARLTDPKRLADMTLRAAGMMAGSALAGSGLTPAEKQLLNEQTQELRQLRETNQQLFQQRLQAAQDLAGEAKYFDPEYYGLQAARKAQAQVARQSAVGLRGLTGEQLAAGQRRARLETSRAAGTGFDIGFQRGMRGQIETRRAGVSAMPTEAPSMMAGYESLGKAYDTAAQRRAKARENIGGLFADVFSEDQSKTPRKPA